MSYTSQQSADRVSQALVPELSGRRRFLLTCFMLAMVGLIWRAVSIQVLDNDFLQGKGRAVHVRDIKIPAYRGKILDRDGNVMAVSAPVSSVWLNPQVLELGDKSAQLIKLLGISKKTLDKKASKQSTKRFVYLSRRIDPQIAEKVDALKIPGLYLQKEYRRYYPDGEVIAHLVGFTDIDDQGLEGLELLFNERLKGEQGVERIIRDGKRRMVEHVDNIRSPVPGEDIHLSIDRRLQYLAYRELKLAVAQQKAKSGSLVLMNPQTGEVLAVANQPAFNPNDLSSLKPGQARNRAFVDVFEPGSTMKPFTVAAGMESGVFDLDSKIETAPGYMKIGRNQVRDHRNYGEIDLATLLLKSSNVAASKVALDIPAEGFWGLLTKLGFGQSAQSQFPGEARGKLVRFEKWRAIETATLSFGYGLSASVLQLAHAYCALANDGVLQPVKLISSSTKLSEGVRVMGSDVAINIREMLEGVVSIKGTAPRAKVEGYSVAGKTGTVKKAIRGGYSDDKYLGIFAGMAPAKNPKLVMVVMIDEPTSGDYYGGLVAAPVFSRVMSGALRLLNIAPDDVEPLPVLATKQPQQLARLGG